MQYTFDRAQEAMGQLAQEQDPIQQDILKNRMEHLTELMGYTLKQQQQEVSLIGDTIGAGVSMATMLSLAYFTGGLSTLPGVLGLTAAGTDARMATEILFEGDQYLMSSDLGKDMAMLTVELGLAGGSFAAMKKLLPLVANLENNAAVAHGLLNVGDSLVTGGLYQGIDSVTLGHSMTRGRLFEAVVADLVFGKAIDISGNVGARMAGDGPYVGSNGMAQYVNPDGTLMDVYQPPTLFEANNYGMTHDGLLQIQTPTATG